jgi:tRNA threonylcarbamoyladenosine biosynthesis protein TsaE
MSIFADLQRGIISSSAEETREVAAALARALPPDSTLALSGDLGAGKTTFVQGLAAAWGIRQPVTSPTFALLQLYRGERLLAHLDAYRLNQPSDYDGLMLEEFLVSPWCLAVEWPEKLGDRLSPQALWLDLSIDEAFRHRIAARPDQGALFSRR